MACRGRDYVTTADKKNKKDHQAESSDAAMGGDSTGDEGEGSKDAGSADGPTSASGRPTGQQDAGSEHASPAAAPPTALPATEAAGTSLCANQLVLLIGLHQTVDSCGLQCLLSQPACTHMQSCQVPAGLHEQRFDISLTPFRHLMTPLRQECFSNALRT